MKNVMTNPRALAFALFAAFAITFGTPAMANDEKKAIAVEKKVIPVELKFIGTRGEMTVFALMFTGTEQTEYTIIVRDTYGYVLYKDNLKAGNVTKNFLLNTGELDDVALKFEISANKTYKPVVFEVSKYSRLVEDVVVSRTK